MYNPGHHPPTPIVHVTLDSHSPHIPNVTVSPTLCHVRRGEWVIFVPGPGIRYLALSFKDQRSPFGDELLWPNLSESVRKKIEGTLGDDGFVELTEHLPDPEAWIAAQADPGAHSTRRYRYTVLLTTDTGKILTVDPEIEIDP